MDKWNGQGLPPVGAECEWCGDKGGYFVPADVIAISDDEIVLRHKCYQDYKPGQFDVFKHKYMKFRPLKSEAERKRDEAVEEMINDAKVNHPCGGNYAITFAQAEQLLDKGYRKVNKPTDEQIEAKEVYSIGGNDQSVGFQAGAKWARSQIMGEES